MGRSVALRIDAVTKLFSGIAAVKDASFEVAAGETVALIGENGAGKSTLMKVAAGVYPAGTYEGSIWIGGKEAAFRSIREAENAGIVLVPQELHVAPNLSIAENMLMGRLPKRLGVIDRVEMRRQSREWLDFFQLDVDASAPASTLSPSEQRLAMISAAVNKSAAKVLILDEPTASFTEGEALHLFEKMEQVRAAGVATIYITHRLDEIETVADRVVVMRNGEVVKETSEVKGNRAAFVRAMIGRDPKQRERKPARTDGEVLLSVSSFTVRSAQSELRPLVDDVSLTIRRGEIVGLFGLVGAGRTELAKAVFGAWDGEVTGNVEIHGGHQRPRSPKEAIARGLAMLTEDRKRSGLIEGQTVLANISAASISEVSSYSVIRRAEERKRNLDLARRLDLRPLTLTANVENFSGGNQQKVLLARWLATDPTVLIVDEPTYGVDIGARFELYRILRELAESGRGVLMISSDLEEIVEESDRILVMYKGRITGEFPAGATRHQLMAAATGDAAAA
ncbi:MAG: sugar ABC transporter ATP-binding protein [Bauldia litoralis]